MANQMKADAVASQNAKMERMGVKVTTGDMGSDPGKGHVRPASDHTQGTIASPYADKYSAGDGKAKATMPPIKGPPSKMNLSKM